MNEPGFEKYTGTRCDYWVVSDLRIQLAINRCNDYKGIFIVMNQHDRKQLEIAHLKLDDMRQDLVDLKNDMEKAHQKTDESLSFIKENLFNPHEGLWAETKENTRFRENSQKWRGIIGVGFIGLVIEKVWSIFT